MAQDATGALTSPDNIPTYNTAADAPSGKGLNAIVAAIQTALSARVTKPTGVVTGDVPVWDSGSSTWKASSSSIATMLPGTTIGETVLSSNPGSSAAEATPTTIVSLPATTFDGVTTVYIEFWVPSANVSTPTAGDFVGLSLWDGTTTDLGRVWVLEVLSAAVATVQGVFVRTKITPPAATKTYTLRGWRTGTSIVNFTAGAGGVGLPRNGSARIVKA